MKRGNLVRKKLSFVQYLNFNEVLPDDNTIYIVDWATSDCLLLKEFHAVSFDIRAFVRVEPSELTELERVFYGLTK
jgi:hypothetical protein